MYVTWQRTSRNEWKKYFGCWNYFKSIMFSIEFNYQLVHWKLVDVHKNIIIVSEPIIFISYQMTLFSVSNFYYFLSFIHNLKLTYITNVHLDPKSILSLRCVIFMILFYKMEYNFKLYYFPTKHFIIKSINVSNLLTWSKMHSKLKNAYFRGWSKDNRKIAYYSILLHNIIRYF